MDTVFLQCRIVLTTARDLYRVSGIICFTVRALNQLDGLAVCFPVSMLV